MPTDERLSPDTNLAILIGGNIDYRTTWGEFARQNADDSELLDEVIKSLQSKGVAEIGGGAHAEFTIRIAP